MEEPHSQPEDDGLLLISEMQRECIRDYIVVCIRRDKHAPLFYLQIQATSENEAMEIAKKQNPIVKVLRAYKAK